jgi:hypothetical protein
VQDLRPFARISEKVPDLPLVLPIAGPAGRDPGREEIELVMPVNPSRDRNGGVELDSGERKKDATREGKKRK